MESSQSRAEAGKLRNGLASKWFRLLGIMCLSHLLSSAIVAQKQAQNTVHEWVWLCSN